MLGKGRRSQLSSKRGEEEVGDDTSDSIRGEQVCVCVNR